MRGDYSGKINFKVLSDNMSDAWFDAYKALRLDRPDYFFLGTRSRYNSVGKDGVFSYDVLYSTKDIKRIQKQLEKCVAEITRSTTRMNIIEREAVIYERIAKKLTYVDHGQNYDHNIAGPVLFSSGVCEGHNALLLVCLRKIGIPCIKVDGKGKGGPHSWAIVWLGSETFHCDVTWDNAVSGTVAFDYFNISDRQISSDHSDYRSTKLPRCTNEQFFYHRYYGLCVSSPTELSSMLRKYSASDRPIRVHLNYKACNGVYSEVNKAFSAGRVYGSHTVYYNDALNNALIMCA